MSPRWAFIGLMFLCNNQVHAQAPAERLDAIFKREWEYTLQQEPTWASTLGDRRYNDRWADMSLDAIDRRYQHAQDLKRELGQIPRDQLSPKDRLNYDLFLKDVDQGIEDHQYRWFLVPLTQRDGIQSEDEEAERWPFDTKKDYEDYIKRLESFPQHADQVMALMRQGIREKRAQPKSVMQRVPGQLSKQLATDPTDSAFFKPLKSFPASVSQSDRQALAARASSAITEGIVPAFRRFKEFFENEYLPACYDQVGVWQFPDGDKFYEFLARRHTTTSMTPKQIHELGLSEVARLDAAMDAIIKQVGFKGTKAEFFKFLRTDKRFFYSNGDELLLSTRALCKRIDPRLTKLFRTIPRAPYGVEPVPDKMAPDTTTAYYEGGSPDGARPGCYRVNLYRPEMRPKWEMIPLTLHEAVPGHHLQISRAMELGDLPEFRRHEPITAFVEGWGLYAESLGDDIGMYDDPYDRFGKLTYEMWRAVRLVVDTGIHSMRWSRQQAIDYFTEHAPKSELDIANEIDRYIAWPGQALAYKVGELEIQRLRKQAMQQLGDKFDLREFDNVLIDQGAVPLDVLDQIVQDWLSSKAHPVQEK